MFIGARIRIYEMDLNYDGIYRMFLISNVVIPTERAQFVNLIPVLEAFYNIKVSGQYNNWLLSLVQTLTSFFL